MAADWITIVTPAISGLAGVSLGGLLHYSITRSQLEHGRTESRRVERLEAYAGYVNHLRHAAIRFAQLIDKDQVDMRAALDEFLIESANRRTSLALVASDRISAFLEERAEAADVAFQEALAAVIPSVEAKRADGSLPADAHEAFRRGIMEAWSKTVRPYVRDLLQVMRDDLKR